MADFEEVLEFSESKEGSQLRYSYIHTKEDLASEEMDVESFSESISLKKAVDLIDWFTASKEDCKRAIIRLMEDDHLILSSQY